MPDPRFQLLSGVPRTPRMKVTGVGSRHRDGRAVPDLQVTWRLLGANNREMGRSVVTYASVDECRDAVQQLKRNLHRLTSRVATGDRRGQWGWSLYLGEEELASSARLFSRLREARVNLDQFLEKVPDAGIVQLNTSAAVLFRRARSNDARVTGPAKERL